MSIVAGGFVRGAAGWCPIPGSSLFDSVAWALLPDEVERPTTPAYPNAFVVSLCAQAVSLIWSNSGLLFLLI
jgi:hypothetical protein